MSRTELYNLSPFPPKRYYTLSMWIQLAALIAGFALLVWGADRFVAGAAATARNLGVSPLLIGLTIVGFGTSAPEILVSVVASLQGNPGLAVGNAIGSNITNVGLILGTTALVVPLSVHSRILRRELPILIGITAAAYQLLRDGTLDMSDGILLLLGLAVLLGYIVYVGLNMRNGKDPMAAEYAAEIPTDLSLGRALIWLGVGFVVLLGSSRLLVWAAAGIAEQLGVSDLIIGLTIVALGTSLPELAASIASALKNEPDIAVGNVIGSNMFNLLAVLGIPGIISAGPVDPAVVTRDMPVMSALTVALLLMAYGFGGEGRINRLEGALLLAAYAGYTSLLYFTAVR
jgi:cation:H+ antiporter